MPEEGEKPTQEDEPGERGDYVEDDDERDAIWEEAVNGEDDSADS